MRTPSVFFATAALAGISSVEASSFGNSFSTGPVSSGNFIRVANSTLVVPATPNPLENILALWTGMGVSNGDLIQAVAVSYPGSGNGDYCGDIGENWCSFASYLASGSGSQTQSNQKAETYQNNQVKMSYIYNPGTDEYDQWVYLNGALISTISSSKGGKATGWGTAEECQPGTPCGTVPQHSWIDTVIELNEADEGYGNTFSDNGAEGTLTSNDGGVTWTGDTITINEFTFS